MPRNAPNAAIAAFIISQTNKRNPIANTSAKENNRSRAISMMVRNPLVCGGGISQMVFKASRSSNSTPDAPRLSWRSRYVSLSLGSFRIGGSQNILHVLCSYYR